MAHPLSRRTFLKASMATFVAATLARLGIDLTSPAGRANAQSYLHSFANGIASGDVTQNSAVVWARATVEAPVVVRFEIARADDPGTVLSAVDVDVASATTPVKHKFEGLDPNTDYLFSALDEVALLVGSFRTAAAPGTRRGLRFGATGDWRGELAPYPAVSNVAAMALDFFVGLGDTVYADIESLAFPKAQAETLEEFRAKHAEGYGERHGLNMWADVRAVTPWIPTIDDHEVTNDFSGGAAPDTDARFAGDVPYINETELYRNGLQAFFEYNPIEDTVWQSDDPLMNGKPKIYRAFRYGDDAGVVVLDNRSFRDAPLEEPTDFTNLGQILSYLNESMTAARTMLGEDQLQALLDDLLTLHTAGVTWKFVVVPEPIQNLGPVASSDRFEGYAYERNRILRHIAENRILNVVFVAADIHGTVVNEVVYRDTALGENLGTGAFEITTGSVAFYPPFAQTVVALGATLGLVDAEVAAGYDDLPIDARETIMEDLLNQQITPLNYPAVGLDGASVTAELLRGRWLQSSTFGWTLFEIDADTQALTITTYGIEPYSPDDAATGSDDVIGREPQVLQQFVVQPKGAAS